MTALISPHVPKFYESILLFGGGGAGKSENIASIARTMPVGAVMHVIDTDITPAWGRILASEDELDEDRVQITEADEGTWEEALEILTRTVANGDHATDWLCLDSISPTWQMVQSWWTEKAYGSDLAAHLAELKIAHGTDKKAYGKALMESMNWPDVKKEYAKLYRQLGKWRGHKVVTAGAKAVGDRDKDEIKLIFGHLGVKPDGEAELHRVLGTNILCVHTRSQEWKLKTAKDRKREEMDGVVVEDFAMDYLVEVAGWVPARKKRKRTAEELAALAAAADAEEG